MTSPPAASGSTSRPAALPAVPPHPSPYPPYPPASQQSQLLGPPMPPPPAAQSIFFLPTSFPVLPQSLLLLPRRRPIPPQSISFPSPALPPSLSLRSSTPPCHVLTPRGVKPRAQGLCPLPPAEFYLFPSFPIPLPTSTYLGHRLHTASIPRRHLCYQPWRCSSFLSYTSPQ